MKNPILKRLYTQEELHHKVSEWVARYEKFRTMKNYQSMASTCYDIGCLFELLENKEKSTCYYEEIVNEWNAHHGEVPYRICVSALRALGRPEEAFSVVLTHAKSWDLIGLANLYEEMDRIGEARLLYAGIAANSLALSNSSSFWRPHYLQEAADLREKAQHFEIAQVYSQRAIEAWGGIEDYLDKSLELIEKAWLYEEVGYIYEKAGRLEKAMDYYRKAQSRYREAYAEDPTTVLTHQIDGDWDRYFGFFARQIPDFRLIYFRPDGPEENDFRRIKYRILSLKGRMRV